MAIAKQADRLMQFSSPLGKDELLIESLDGAEGISRLFEYHVELLATKDTEIDPRAIVGAKVNIAIALNDVQGSRWINGIVASFEQCAGDEELDVYRARIVPSIWQLTLSSNCRVFQSKTVIEIVKAVIGEYGLSVQDKTTKTYRQLDYCTQYSESDFHFISRLMEESGIFYFFEHTDGDHKLLLGDALDTYQPCALSSSIPFELSGAGAEGAYGARVSEFTSTSTMVTGKHSTADYNYRTYARLDVPEVTSPSDFGKNAFDAYLYPAGEEGYLKDIETPSSSKLETLFLKARGDASDATAQVFRGTGNARSMCAGYTFTMKQNPRTEWNRKFLITGVTTHVDQIPSFRAEDSASGDGYSNHFTAISSDTLFAPPKTFVKPRIYGPQTAKVVADSGEEIHIDKLGRVNIQFMWDKLRPTDKVDNTWVRVAQQWAGNGWGTYFWPRLHDEVIVAFLDGDPDNPVIVGSVYNGVNVPKYALPDNSTRSGILTRSSKQGGAANANELRFEDKKGSEQIFINAERDMDLRVENDNRLYVGGNDASFVKGNQTEEVDGKFQRLTKGDAVEQIQGDSDLEVKGNLTEKVGQNCTLNVGMSQSEKVGENYSLDAGMQIYLKGGMSVTIEAGMELTLKGSGGFITIGPSGVAISGTMVLINSGGAAGSGSAGNVPDPKSPQKPDIADDGTKGGKM
jgi:type VI secretion system secreted protein VgrG